MVKTKKIWVLDVDYIKDYKIQKRRYICTNKETLERYRKTIAGKILKHELKPGRVSKDTVENNVVKLMCLKED